MSEAKKPKKSKPKSGEKKVTIPTIVDLLTAATVEWYDEMMKGYFNEPNSFEARLGAAEALVFALQTIAERDPEDGRMIQKYLIAKLRV
jgi:hypothetical protein